MTTSPTAPSPATEGGAGDRWLDAGVRVTQQGPVLTVTLCRPEKRNAQTPALWRALAEVAASRDPGVRAVVLRAEGPAFSAGLDLAMLSPEGIPGEPPFAELAADPDRLDAAIDGYQQGFSWLADPALLTIAVVQGAAVGAGFQLALACDLRVATPDARFCMREPALGLVPDLTGTLPLVRAVGYPRAIEWCATARWVDADEALRTGLVNAVAPLDEVDAVLTGWLEPALATPRGAVAGTKALLQQAIRHDLDTQRAAERHEQLGRLRALLGGE